MSEEHTKELEPCPFCGSPAFVSWDGDVNTPDDWSVNCDNTLKCGATVGGMSSEADAKTAWNSRTSLVAPQGDAHNRAVQLVDAWIVDRRLFPPQRYATRQDFRILKEWIARALTDYAASSPVTPSPTPDAESRDLWAKMELLKQRFEAATTHDEVAALVWACRALIDADAEEAPFFAPEAQDRMMVYSTALSLYFEHAQRVLGRSPLPIEVDEVEAGFCDPRLEALKPERMERGRQLLATITAPPSTQPSARVAAEEIVDELFQHATQLTATIAGDPVGIASYSPNYVIEKVTAIISRHFSVQPVEEQPRFASRLTSLNKQGVCDHSEPLTSDCERCTSVIGEARRLLGIS